MSLLTVEEKSSYLSIRFLAQESANALSLNAARELAALPKKFKASKKPIVVSSAHPRVFCSGGNLTDYKKLKSKGDGLKVNREISKALDAFGAWPVMKIAYVNGDVLGGGMEWLARFDFRWSAPHALFAFWQRRIGLATGWGGGAWWARKIGEDRLRQLLIEAQPLPASQAMKAGLIDRVVLDWRRESELAQFCQGLESDSARAANRWSAKEESKIFSNLWLNKEHAEVLKRWK